MLGVTDRGLPSLNRLASLTELQLWNCPNITTGGLLGFRGHMDLKTLGVRACAGIPPEDDNRLKQAFPNATIIR